MNIFDLDGVITIGLMPTKFDKIVTGRSIEEKPETERYLMKLGLNNEVFYNPIPYDKKSRTTSALFKVDLMDWLIKKGYDIKLLFEDDPIQAKIIRHKSNVTVIDIVQHIWQKNNTRHED